jgi:hypothetical protein
MLAIFILETVVCCLSTWLFYTWNTRRLFIKRLGLDSNNSYSTPFIFGLGVLPSILKASRENQVLEMFETKYWSNVWNNGSAVLHTMYSGDNEITVADPEFAKEIAVMKGSNFSKGPVYDHAKIVMGNGLLTSEGMIWKKQRTLLNPVFSQKKIDVMTETVVTNCLNYLSTYWDKQQKIISFNFEDEMSNLALTMLINNLFGSSGDAGHMAKLWRSIESGYVPLYSMYSTNSFMYVEHFHLYLEVILFHFSNIFHYLRHLH